MMRTDLGFLLDTSSSVTSSDFGKMKQFMEAIIDEFSVTQALTHVSAMTYAGDTKLEFAFSDHLNPAQLQRAIQGIRQRSVPSTRIDKALIAVNNQMFTSANGARSNANKVSHYGLLQGNCEILLCISSKEQYAV